MLSAGILITIAQRIHKKDPHRCVRRRPQACNRRCVRQHGTRQARSNEDSERPMTEGCKSSPRIAHHEANGRIFMRQCAWTDTGRSAGRASALASTPPPFRDALPRQVQCSIQRVAFFLPPLPGAADYPTPTPPAAVFATFGYKITDSPSTPTHRSMWPVRPWTLTIP